MSPQPISVSNLTFGYTSEPIFKNFCLRLDGEFNLIKGPSGCGKTTLLKLLGGFLPADGRATISGIRSQPILLLQEDSLWPWMTGLDNIRLILGVSEEAVRSFSLYPLIASFVARPAFELSFGQRRLIELVRAFLAPADVLMLDEPFNFLDRQRRSKLIEYALGRAVETTIIMTSHYSESISSTRIRTYEFVGDMPYSELATGDEQRL